MDQDKDRHLLPFILEQLKIEGVASLSERADRLLEYLSSPSQESTDSFLRDFPRWRQKRDQYLCSIERKKAGTRFDVPASYREPVKSVLNHAIEQLQSLGEHANDASRHVTEDLQPILPSLKEKEGGKIEKVLMANLHFLLDKNIEFHGQIEQVQQSFHYYQARIAELEAKLEKREEELQKDHLTGLLNRKAFDEVMDKLIPKAEAEDGELVLLLIDLDFFKQINDTFGHKIGDDLLTHFGHLLTQHIRSQDYAVRMGGDEFALVFWGLDIASSAIVTERIQKFLNHHTYHFDGQSVHVTISGGLAMFRPGESKQDFYVRTDSILYEAKKNGRNRIEVETL